MKRILFTLFFSTLISSLFSQNWTTSEIGVCPTVFSYDCILENGRNDGINRIYVTTRDGGIYEWTFNGTSWEYITIDEGLTNLITLAVGDARNDGTNRIYAGQWNPDKDILEYTWNGTNWESLIIGTESLAATSLIIGSLKNPDENRLYVSGFFGNKEYFWNGFGWDINPVDGVSFGVEGPGMIADGRNDDTLRLYIPQKAGREFSWTGTDWEVTTLTGDFWPESSIVANGRNDGLNRVFVQDWSGGWECTWNGSSWDVNDITGILGRGEWYAGIAKDDGKINLYSSMVGLAFKEFSWSSATSQYIDSIIVDASTGATSCIAIGNGRNDDTARIYIPHYANGGIYEITYKNPYVYNSTKIKTSEQKTSLKIFPNPASEFVNISLEKTGLYHYQIMNSAGKIVKAGSFTSSVFKKNLTINTENFISGLYTFHITNGDYIMKEKIIISGN